MRAPSKNARNRAAETPAAAARARACAIVPSRGVPALSACARVRRMWCWSSAILARCEKKPKARMICSAWAGGRLFSVVSRVVRAAASSSRWKRTAFWRMLSTVSKTAPPACSRIVSPRMRPSNRMSSRSGRSLSSASTACGPAIAASVRPNETDRCRKRAAPKKRYNSVRTAMVLSDGLETHRQNVRKRAYSHSSIPRGSKRTFLANPSSLPDLPSVGAQAARHHHHSKD